MWLQRVRYDWSDWACTHTCLWKKKIKKKKGQQNLCVVSLPGVSTCVAMSKGCSQASGWPWPGVSVGWRACSLHTWGAVLNQALTGPGHRDRVLWLTWVCQVQRSLFFCFLSYFAHIPRIPWNKEWQPTPVFLSGESHGQRSLED